MRPALVVMTVEAEEVSAEVEEISGVENASDNWHSDIQSAGCRFESFTGHKPFSLISATYPNLNL